MVARKVSNAAGLQKTLKALAGRLEDDDAALVALTRGLAAAVDADPDNAALWREYRAALAELTAIGAEDPDEDTRDFLLQIRTPGLRPKMGDTEKP